MSDWILFPAVLLLAAAIDSTYTVWMLRVTGRRADQAAAAAGTIWLFTTIMTRLYVDDAMLIPAVALGGAFGTYCVTRWAK